MTLSLPSTLFWQIPLSSRLLQSLMESAGIKSRSIRFSIIAIAVLLRRTAQCQNTGIELPGCRAHAMDLAQFGGVGDGIASNTNAFRDAIANLSCYASDGGSMLVVPAGRWLTGPFNITASHFTLYLEENAEILASTDIDEYPIVAPLPSYGRGRDTPGGRYSNFIWGSNLTDVIITGENGTINGQGQFWWDKFHKKELNSTRGYLLELMFSEYIVISNLTFVNSSAWNLHPVYCKSVFFTHITCFYISKGSLGAPIEVLQCVLKVTGSSPESSLLQKCMVSNVIISGVTVLAPVDSPNTDGINPDSCSNVLIEDSFVVSGDDCIAIKSGWDEYGISFGRPSEHILIRRFSCISPDSAVIALGSEMSGGIQDVRAENIVAINSESAVRIKTGAGRGGFVRDIFVRGVTLHTMKYVFWITGNYGDHPDDKWDPKALPEITRINYSDIFAENVTMAARLEGIENDTFTDICISNVTLGLSAKPKKVQWSCALVEGRSSDVSPRACDELPEMGTPCAYPPDLLPIEHVKVGCCNRY
ncbi:putative polygalacturonase [Platanthera guangdongensis]|uniref:Polygalacturonase n=1 Tax=Platanthera guangdongensis TaxID=2320717 RepID=A0ABR2LP67_9ASPA